MRLLVSATAMVGALLLASCDGQQGDSSPDILDPVVPQSDPAEQAAVVIKDGLRSPDSFEYLDGKVIWEGTYKGNPAYVTLVSYNAQNGFGALLRGCAIVAFSDTQDDAVSWNSLYGMQETDRALCERSSDAGALADIAETVADLNFPSDKPATTSAPSEAETSTDSAEAAEDEAAKEAEDAAKAAEEAALDL